MNTLLKLTSIKKSYLREVLSDINLDVYPGELVYIIGESGCGKSTLGNIILGIEDADAGQIFFKEQEYSTIKDFASLRRESLVYIFQSYNLIENISVYDNIFLPYVFDNEEHPNIDERIDELLTLLNLNVLENQTIRTLSGGEKQRVAIARSLLLDPELIIADEPTGNLDEQNELIILNFFKQLVNQGKSVIFITHNLHLINKGDTIYQLSGGELHAQT